MRRRDHIVPPVDELAAATVKLLGNGPQASRTMRETLSASLGFRPDDVVWPRFVNNHAWALVRMQANGTIRKRSAGVYELISPMISPDQDKAVTPEIKLQAALPRWAARMIAAANRRNIDRWAGEAFTEADLRELWQRCDGRCAMTGLPFLETQVGTGAAKKAYAPSLDRIDCEKPYSRDNCRLVQARVNFALNRFGDEVFLEMAQAAIIHQRQRLETLR